MLALLGLALWAWHALLALLGCALWAWHALLALLGCALGTWHALLEARSGDALLVVRGGRTVLGGRTLHGDAGHGLVLIDPLPTVPPAQALAASGIWVPSGYWLRHDRPFSF